MLKFVSSAVGVVAGAAVIFGSAAVSQAVMTGFESGYATGTLDGQNGWVHGAGAGLTVTSGAGNPGVAAVSTDAGTNGSYLLSGETLVTGVTYRFALDATVAAGAQIYVGLGWTGHPFINMAAWNGYGSNDGFQLASTPGSSPYPTAGMDEQWYHMTLDYTAGGNAVMTVVDASNVQVFNTTVDVSSINPAAATLSELTLYANGGGVGAGTAFDNVSFGALPEPSCLGLIGLAGAMFFRRRRR